VTLKTGCFDRKLGIRPDETGALLAADFVEFGRSGAVWNRQQTLDGLAQEQPMERSMKDFSARPLSEGVALVTYRSVRRDPVSDREWHSLRNSIWKLTDGRWQMTFHQGTPTRPNPYMSTNEQGSRRNEVARRPGDKLTRKRAGKRLFGSICHG
jgi:hypothetical protein